MFHQAKKATLGSNVDRPPAAMCVQAPADSGGLVLTTDPKPRLRWTVELHERFVDAVTQLGGPDSTITLYFILHISSSIYDDINYICVFFLNILIIDLSNIRHFLIWEVSNFPLLIRENGFFLGLTYELYLLLNLYL